MPGTPRSHRFAATLALRDAYRTCVKLNGKAHADRQITTEQAKQT